MRRPCGIHYFVYAAPAEVGESDAHRIWLHASSKGVVSAAISAPGGREPRCTFWLAHSQYVKSSQILWT